MVVVYSFTTATLGWLRCCIKKVVFLLCDMFDAMDRPDKPEQTSGTREHDARDLEAVSEVMRGNPDAFAEIVNRYQRTVLSLARSYFDDNFDAEDAAQEVFIRVYRRLASFDLTLKFFPWMYTVAVNYMKSRKVTQNRRGSIEFPVDTQSEEGRLLIDSGDHAYRSQISAEETVLQSEDQQKVRKAVRSLPKKLRDPAILYYLEELSISEVAVSLGIGRENVKSRLHRARKKLRKFFLEMQP